MLKQDKTYYKRNILISVIISEILVISAFVLFPRESTNNTKIIISDPVVLYDDIPQTTKVQLNQLHLLKYRRLIFLKRLKHIKHLTMWL